MKRVIHDDVQSNPTASTEYGIKLGNEAAFSLEKITSFRHNYQDHPLMQLDRLAQLAKVLMRKGRCRFITPDTKQSSQFTPRLQNAEGLGIEEIFRRIEEPGSWIGLYFVETDPAYEQFLKQILGSVQRIINEQQPEHPSGNCKRFLSRSSGSIHVIDIELGLGQVYGDCIVLAVLEHREQDPGKHACNDSHRLLMGFTRSAFLVEIGL
jgi:hypothetical protein